MKVHASSAIYGRRDYGETVRNAFSLKCMQVPPAFFFTGFDFSPTLYDIQFIASRVVLTASKLQFQWPMYVSLKKFPKK